MGHCRCGCSLPFYGIFLLAAAIQVSAFIVVPSPLPTRHLRLTATGSTPSTPSNANSIESTGRRRWRRRRRSTAVEPAASSASPPSEDASFPTPEVKGTAKASNGEDSDAATGTTGGDGSTSSAADRPMPSAALPEVPSYRRVYDSAMKLLESELKLEPYPIPEGLEGNCAVVGKGRHQQTVKTSITAFRSAKFRQIRAALVETDGPTQVLNLVMFPYPSYDLPIFGADLVSLPGAHLVCIDLQPAHSSQQRDDKVDAALSQANRRHLDALPWGGDLPEAAQKFFSPHCLWSKLGAKEPVEQKALEATMDYLREYLRLVHEAEPLAEDAPLEIIAAGHADYSNYRRENDPARGMLTRFYGSEWTEAAIEGILFDFNFNPE